MMSHTMRSHMKWQPRQGSPGDMSVERRDSVPSKECHLTSLEPPQSPQFDWKLQA